MPCTPFTLPGGACSGTVRPCSFATPRPQAQRRRVL